MNREKLLRDLYTEDHLTVREIGVLLGKSHVAIYRALVRMGIKATDGERVTVSCTNCNKGYWIPRARWKKVARPYCSEKCYFEALHNPDYVQSRDGQRIARRVVSEHFRLREGNVIHHVDSNDTHNEASNLWVFDTQADHMAWHRGRKDVKPIWRLSKGK